ncbi:5-hydroxytryptamine receptor 1B-like [Patiria miniata]|uniref:G-protein coupled receptors family 1 profile domain-containing protein n=1 Tax=Patiria miniata TaxID=46514 RepID=A0A913ZKX7_PATMI|nr:5-hydroxytryptamine receptor 1B-like [Patiria miniata]
MASQEIPPGIKEACHGCYYVIIVVMWLQAAITIVANLLAIAAFFRAKRICRKISNYFILNLSIADLLVGVMVIPLNNLFVYYGYWPFGKIACKFWLLFQFACTVLSGFALVLISWDRFMWVRAPLLYISYQSKKRAISVIMATVLASYVFVSVIDVEWEELSGVRNINYTLECASEGIHSLAYAMVTLVFEFLLPMTLLTSFNALVFVKIRRILLARQRTESGTISMGIDDAHEQKHSSSSGGSGSVLTSGDAGASPSNPRMPGSQAYRKSAIMLALMTGTFLICWCPWFITVFINALGVPVSPYALWGVSYLMFFNSAINPFLYASTNVHYRAQMMSFLCFLRRR